MPDKFTLHSRFLPAHYKSNPNTAQESEFESNNFPSPSAPIEMGWWWVWVTACLPGR